MANLIRSAVCAVLLCFMGFGAYGGENLLFNPGFEQDTGSPLPEGYQKGNHFGKKAPDSAFVVDKAEKKSGEQSLKMTCQNSNVPTIVLSKTIEGKTGDTFEFSVFIKAEGDKSLQCRIFVLSSDYKSVASKTISINNKWQKYSVTMTVNNKQKSDLVFARVDLQNSGTIWLDDLSLVKTGGN